jgi:uncharacterized protein (DUF58 family)
MFGRAARAALTFLWPTQRVLWTREGGVYILAWVGLMVVGFQQQVNLILLVAGLAAGPVVASFLVSWGMLRKLRAGRRLPPYAFAGDPFPIDYTLENDRRWTAALALFLEDEGVPADRAVSGSSGLGPRVFFERVPGRDRARVRWTGTADRRGRYRFRTMEVATRSPFGLVERRVMIDDPGELIVYPAVGQLTRRWHLMQRQATETRRGRRHDRTAQQQEYHGLRDYRPGDSPRWIHWRTSARVGQPMVKEFEQQNEQDLAVLLDPWLPRTKVAPEQREALEQAVGFAATLCLETCRSQGRRLLLGWTGPTPGLRQGPASVKLLHELLEQLAVLRASSEGALAALFDIMPPATLREAVLVVVSTRPVNLIEEAEQSSRLSGASARGLLGRVVLLDASRGDLDDLVQYTGASVSTALSRHTSHAAAEREAAFAHAAPRDHAAEPAAAGAPARPAGPGPNMNGREGRP